MNINLGLSEDITIRVKFSSLTEVVIATTTAEDITVYVTIIQFHTGMSCLIDTLQGSYRVFFTRHINNTTSDCRNLSTTEERVTHMTAVHRDIRSVNTTVIDIATAKDITTILQTRSTITRPCLIV